MEAKKACQAGMATESAIVRLRQWHHKVMRRWHIYEEEGAWREADALLVVANEISRQIEFLEST